MTDGHVYDRYRKQVQPVLTSKLEEFYLLGYGTITEDSLWGFLTKKKWRKQTEDIPLHELVQQIMSVNVGEYMNYATVEAFKFDEFTTISEEERRELLK